MNNLICVVKIEPGHTPMPDFIENDVLELLKLVNVDRNGNPCDDIEPFEIVKIRDNIHIVSSPKAEERNLPLVRRVGRYTEFYGVMYIVKIDSGLNLHSLTTRESTDFCIKFLDKELPLESLGFSPIDYDYHEENDEHSEPDNGYRRISITFDD